MKRENREIYDKDKIIRSHDVQTRNVQGKKSLHNIVIYIRQYSQYIVQEAGRHTVRMFLPTAGMPYTYTEPASNIIYYIVIFSTYLTITVLSIIVALVER